MRALTLKPHWAHAVAHLGKRIENRSNPIPPDLIGERVATHAGASRLPRRWLSSLERAAPDGFDRRPFLGGGWRSIQTRAIVATAVLVCSDGGPYRAGDWGDPAAAYWWTFSDVITLDEPIPWQRGQLGLWHIDRREGGAEVVERLREVA